jgi:hypothetical protein
MASILVIVDESLGVRAPMIAMMEPLMGLRVGIMPGG